MTRTRPLVLLLALVLAAAACGDDDAGEATTAPGAPATTEAPAATGAPGTTEAPATTEAPGAPAPAGGGSAVLTVGDETWEFSGSVLCAFGPEEIGQEGAEFVLSAFQGGLQLYVSVDSYGDSVSIDDIEDFENPSVSLIANAFTVGLTGGSEDIVTVSGKQVAAEALFLDDTSDSFEGIPGTLTATCP